MTPLPSSTAGSPRLPHPVFGLVLRLGLGLVLAWLGAVRPAAAQPASALRPSGVAKPEAVPSLIATLKRAEATTFEKARACQQLAIVGTPEAVVPLATLLDHPQLAAYARDALEAIPGPAATEALRAALPKLEGDLLVGVVNSLGVRRDPSAVASLISLVGDPARGAAPAAMTALARIPSPDAIAALRQTLGFPDANLRAHAGEATLFCAQAEVARGRAEAGAALFDAIRQADVPPSFRLLATRGAILARGGQGVPLLLESLRSDDPAARQMAIAVAREVKDSAVSKALAEELARSSTPVQILILRTLADRGDRSVHAAVGALASAPTPAVRIAALETLGSIGEASSVPLLMKALAEAPEPAEAEAAEASLVQLEAGDPEVALLSALPGAPPAARARMIAILGYRGSTAATAELLRQAADPEPMVARAAFDALAAVAGTDELPRVIRVAVTREDAAIREKAERAVYEIAVKQADPTRRSEPLAAAYGEVTGLSGKNSLLQVMSMLADPPAYRVVTAAWEDPTPEIRDAALRVLVNWPDSTPAPLLLKVFQTTDNEVHRTLALRGVITMATLWRDQPPASPGAVPRPPRKAIEWLTAANGAIRNQAGEKKLILSGLGDLNCVEGLELLRPYLDDAAVQNDAAQAILRACRGLTSTEEKAAARPLLEKIASASPDADIRKEAEALLKKL